MLREEADELIKVINSFVEPVTGMTGTPGPELVEPMPEVGEGEVISEDKAPVELTETELRKAFRNQVPEGFDPAKVEMVRSPKTGDRVFLKYEDERRWVPDLPTLEAFGFGLEDVKEIKDEELEALKEGYGILTKKLW